MLQQYIVMICIMLMGADVNGQHPALTNGPCNFLSTINITGGYRDDNGNFIYKNDIYPKESYFETNYIIENMTEIVMVESHIRGCVCTLKPCINICCIDNDGTNTKKNSACIKTETLQVFDKENNEMEIALNGHEYGILNNGRPCGQMYKLEPFDYPDQDQWSFLKVRLRRSYLFIHVYFL